MRKPGERLPRFKRKRGKIRKFRTTPRDEKIILIVGRHRIIRSTQIIALLQAEDPSTSEQNVTRRLQLLFHGGYLSRPLAQVETYKAGSGSQPIVFILGNKGIDLLVEKYGFRRSSADYTSKARTSKSTTIEHELGATDFMVALAIACLRHGRIQMIYFDEIMRELAPPETKRSLNPYRWPVTVRLEDQPEETLYVSPDRTFGIRVLDRPEGRQRKFFFYEKDRSTMPVVRPNLSKSSLLRKMVMYGFSYEDDLHTKFYGLPNVRVLTTVKTPQRITTILAAHRRYTVSLMPPGLCMFTDDNGLFAAEDFFSYKWVNAAGELASLLD